MVPSLLPYTHGNRKTQNQTRTSTRGVDQSGHSVFAETIETAQVAELIRARMETIRTPTWPSTSAYQFRGHQGRQSQPFLGRDPSLHRSHDDDCIATDDLFHNSSKPSISWCCHCREEEKQEDAACLTRGSEWYVRRGVGYNVDIFARGIPKKLLSIQNIV